MHSQYQCKQIFSCCTEYSYAYCYTHLLEWTINSGGVCKFLYNTMSTLYGIYGKNK